MLKCDVNKGSVHAIVVGSLPVISAEITMLLLSIRNSLPVECRKSFDKCLEHSINDAQSPYNKRKDTAEVF